MSLENERGFTKMTFTLEDKRNGYAYLAILALLLITSGCTDQQDTIVIDQSVQPSTKVIWGCNESGITYAVPDMYLPGYNYYTEEATLVMNGKRTTYTILWAKSDKDITKRVLVSYFDGQCKGK